MEKDIFTAFFANILKRGIIRGEYAVMLVGIIITIVNLHCYFPVL